MPAAVESCVDLILEYYRSVTPKRDLQQLREPTTDVLTTMTQGLGDTMMLTDLPAAAARAGGGRCDVFSPSKHFRPLMQFNPYFREVKDKAYLVNAPDLIRQYDCGNGHYFQRLRRGYGLLVDDKPRGFIGWKGQRCKNRVILHFDPGLHANWQRQHVHKRARVIYPETRKAIEDFVAARKDLQFYEVGANPLRIKGTTYIATADTPALVRCIGAAAWFLGIMSGPMHVAAALGLRGIVIVNFPAPNKIFLPTLVVTGQIEEEWMYFQNVHLHQDGEGPLVKRATTDNLKRAFNGELYPFWDDKYGALIHEKL